MALLDFDYLIVSNQRFSEDSLSATVHFFSKLGIRKFIFTIDFDLNLRTVPWIADRLKQLERILKTLRPRGAFFYVCANFMFTQGAAYDPHLSRLCVARSNVLFLQLPYFVEADWIHSDLNHLLFKQKLSPVFTSFENNLRTNPSETLEKCLNSRFFRFAVDINYLTALDSETLIKRITREKIPIVPCISHELSNYAGALAAFSQLRQAIGDPRYFQLCRVIQQTGRALFTNL